MAKPVDATNRAAAEIMEILTGMDSPRHAAAALALVRANLHLQAGGDTEGKVLAMIGNDNKATLELWRTIADSQIYSAGN